MCLITAASKLPNVRVVSPHNGTIADAHEAGSNARKTKYIHTTIPPRKTQSTMARRAVSRCFGASSEVKGVNRPPYVNIEKAVRTPTAQIPASATGNNSRGRLEV